MKFQKKNIQQNAIRIISSKFIFILSDIFKTQLYQFVYGMYEYSESRLGVKDLMIQHTFLISRNTDDANLLSFSKDYLTVELIFRFQIVLIGNHFCF